MGIAYLLMLIVYIALAKGIYTIITKFTTKVWIKRSVIAFFILFPTYDIIIGNALKFYYCQFTELEKINRMIERPEGILLEDNSESYSQVSNSIDAESYIHLFELKMVQIKHQDNITHTYFAKNEYIDNNDNRRLRIEEIPNTTFQARYHWCENYLKFPWPINKFLEGYENKIIDSQTNEVIAWSKVFSRKDYNFDIFGGFRAGRMCGGETHWKLLKKTIKDKK